MGEDTILEYLNFSQALCELQSGKKLQRKGWNGKGMYLELQKPDSNSKMTEPYIYMVIPNQSGVNEPVERIRLIPWLASQSDLLALDWVIV